MSVPPPLGAVDAGGSVASMSVSAPLLIRVSCEKMKKDYTLLYLLIAIMALIGFLLVKKYRKPKAQRYEEQMRALKARLAREKKKK